MENLPLNEKQPPFALALTPILQDKKQNDDQNQNILHRTVLKSMPFWPELNVLNVTFCHSSCQCSDELYCSLDQSGDADARATNDVNMRQSIAVTVSLFLACSPPS